MGAAGMAWCIVMTHSRDPHMPDHGGDPDEYEVPDLRMAGLSEEDSELLRREIERQERDGGTFRVGGYAWDD